MEKRCMLLCLFDVSVACNDVISVGIIGGERRRRRRKEGRKTRVEEVWVLRGHEMATQEWALWLGLNFEHLVLRVCYMSPQDWVPNNF